MKDYRALTQQNADELRELTSDCVDIATDAWRLVHGKVQNLDSVPIALLAQILLQHRLTSQPQIEHKQAPEGS